MSSPSANSGQLDTRSLLTGALQVSLGAAVGLDLAPFGYALLLTPMQRSPDWSYAQADQVNSANVLGHLLPVLIPRSGASYSRRCCSAVRFWRR